MVGQGEWETFKASVVHRRHDIDVKIALMRLLAVQAEPVNLRDFVGISYRESTIAEIYPSRGTRSIPVAYATACPHLIDEMRLAGLVEVLTESNRKSVRLSEVGREVLELIDKGTPLEQLDEFLHEPPTLRWAKRALSRLRGQEVGKGEYI